MANAKIPHRQIALDLGRSRARITNLLRLSTLPSDIQEWIRRGQLTTKHGEALVGLQSTIATQLAIEAMNSLWSAGRLRKAVKAVRQGAPVPEDPNTAALANKLSEMLGAKVRITFAADRSGQLIIGFADFECLDGVLERLGYEP